MYVSIVALIYIYNHKSILYVGLITKFDIILMYVGTDDHFMSYN